MLSDANYNVKQNKTEGTGIKILTPKQMLQRLPIAFAQIKAGNNSESFLNEIRQIVYSLYQSKQITKKVYNHMTKLKNIHTWRNIKSSYKNNKFKISAPTWNDEFELPDGFYSVSDIHNCFKYIFKKHGENTNKPSVQIYVNKTENRITFKINHRYSLELLTPETMKLLGSTKSETSKDKNGENVPHLEITEVVLVHCNMVNNDYQQDSRVLYTFAPNKPFCSLLEISATKHIFLKTFNSEFQDIEVWFTDQNSKPLEIEDKTNLTMVIKASIIKMRYSIEPRDRIYVKGYGFLSFAKNMGKSLNNKYGQKLLDSAKKSTTDAIKTASKRAIQKTAEATGDLIGNKIADKITSVSKKKSTKELHNNDETEDVEITSHKKRYVSPEERQQIINELRLVPKSY